MCYILLHFIHYMIVWQMKNIHTVSAPTVAIHTLQLLYMCACVYFLLLLIYFVPCWIRDFIFERISGQLWWSYSLAIRTNCLYWCCVCTITKSTECELNVSETLHNECYIWFLCSNFSIIISFSRSFFFLLLYSFYLSIHFNACIRIHLVII